MRLVLRQALRLAIGANVARADVTQPCAFRAHQLEAGPLCAETEVDVAEVAEEAAIEDADAIEQRAADEHRVAREHVVDDMGEFVLAGDVLGELLDLPVVARDVGGQDGVLGMAVDQVGSSPNDAVRGVKVGNREDGPQPRCRDDHVVGDEEDLLAPGLGKPVGEDARVVLMLAEAADRDGLGGVGPKLAEDAGEVVAGVGLVVEEDELAAGLDAE